MSAVTIEEVRRVAELANLELTTAEEVSMQRDLSAVLGYVAQLAQLNTASIDPMAQVGEVIGVANSGVGNSLRGDSIRPSTNRVSVMSAAPESDGRFFKVPKVIER